MTFTKADLIAARESVDMIPKEALDIFGGDPEKQKRAETAHGIFKEAESPEYWRNLANSELAGLDGQDLIDGQKAFIQRHSKKLINDVDAYNKLNQGAASGGMLDRYSGSAGALGLGIGALLGGVFGGKSGALIGGLIGGIGLYAMQKLGIGGEGLQNFFKTAVDKVLGPQAGRVDKDKMLKGIQTAADRATGATEAPEAPEAPVPSPDESVPTVPTDDQTSADYITDSGDFAAENLAKPVEDPVTPPVVETPPAIPTVAPQMDEGDAIEARINAETEAQVQKELAQTKLDYTDRVKVEQEASAAKSADRQAASEKRKADNMNKRPAISGTGAQSKEKPSVLHNLADKVLPKGKTGYTGLLRPLNAFGAWHDTVLGGKTKNKIKALSPEKPDLSNKTKDYLSDPFDEGL